MTTPEDPQGADETINALVRDVTRRMRRRPDAVFELESPERIVPLMPVQELLFAIQEIGVRDAGDLVGLATPAQLRSFLDLSIWVRDRIEPDETEDWVSMLLELDDDDFLVKMNGLDLELLGTTLRTFCEVCDPQLQPVPELDMAPYTTPDTFFLVFPRTPEPDPETGVIDEDWDPEADDRFPLMIKLIDKLYRTDPDLARHLIMETASSTTSELEELSYRWRSARLADLGYEPYSDALEILQFLDPAKLTARIPPPDPPAPTRDPEDTVSLGGVLLEPWTSGAEETYLSACLETLSVEETDRVTQGYTFLANRLAAATLVRPGSVEEMREVLTRARRGLNLGLEYLTRRKPAAAAEVIARVPVTTVFRVGHSLTLQLQRLVNALGRAGRLSLSRRGFTLLESPWRELAEGLTRRFPELTRGFDEPPAAVSPPAVSPSEGFRPLLSLADLLSATQLVEDLSALWPLCFVALDISPAWLTDEGLAGCKPSEPGAVRLGDLFRTAAVRHLLGEGLTVAPLTVEQREAARPKLREQTSGANLVSWAADLGRELSARFRSKELEPPPRLERVLTHWLQPLRAGLQGSTLWESP